MDPTASYIQGGRSSDGVHNLRCERVDIYWVRDAVKKQVMSRKPRMWKSWWFYRIKDTTYRDIPGVAESTARRDVQQVDALIDAELDRRDMLGDWR